MIEVLARPVPSGTMSQEAPASFWIWLQGIWNANAGWILLIFVILGMAKLMLNRMQKMQARIEKLWKFILFFLYKRQMMLPLVHTLAKREKALDHAQLQELLDIREHLQKFPLPRTPRERISWEQKISKLLFRYFSHLEKNGILSSHSALHQVVEDLEFIDEKLVQLQQVYNHEVAQWNHQWRFLPPKFFGIRRFEPFSE